ncbi:TonB-dependent receptor [Propionivibrio sp.]|uniref:TonB-dependent receptor family protein n=1 Tax=Propionivibrio sp. TaxID=2212460 RepID=UPI0025F8EFAB|nr:TonB-dependent receptor [Propionivibrio sp.]MBK7354898.1 TonB-dependent receptor [Propionivibrio sp.]MBK8402267.1 TonB-dependent receptor [Propionivibrio sp.]MBK8743425.1 TonB-dependent receptor [Propionivibrio sp.]MBK8892728.1 TonB-dependent receptor [Propionivibrio sp.]
MFPRCSIVLSVLALTASFSAIAAEKDADDAAIVVTATRFSEADYRVSSNISVITRQDIRNTPAQSLPDVLGSLAGIDVRQFGGSMGKDATVDMRGFGSTATSNTLILVDGLRVNPVDLGSIIWSSLPLESVERIEIVRGSGTVLYGDGATGGVINIITNKSGNPVAGVTATLGSFGYKGVDVQLANGNDRAYYNLFAKYADADGFRKNGQQDQKTASGRAGYLLDHGEIFADFAIYSESSGLPGSIFSAAYHSDPRSTRFPRNTEDRDGYRIRPGISYRVSEQVTLEAEAGREHQILKSSIVSSSFFSDRTRDTHSFTPRLRWRHGMGSLFSETVIGTDFYDSDVSSHNLGAPDQGATQKSSAVYLQNTTGITSNLSLTLGGREQRVKQTASQDAYAAWFSPAFSGSSTRGRSAYDLGLTYAQKGWRIYAKTGTTFRFANTDELFGFDPVLFVPVFAGDLKPQHGTINEAGGSVSVGSANVRASFYKLDLTDEIGYDGAVGANINLAPTRRKGAELEADWKLANSVFLKTSYAYIDASFREGTYAGKEIPLVARNQANAQLTWHTGRTGSYTAAARYVGDRRYGSDFTNSQGILSGYFTLDLQAVWDLKPWKIAAKVLNATDKKYSPFAGYSSTFSDTYFYPADGRSIFVSGRYDF